MLLGHFLNLVPQVPSGRKLLLSQGVNTFWNLCSPSVRVSWEGAGPKRQHRQQQQLLLWFGDLKGWAVAKEETEGPRGRACVLPPLLSRMRAATSVSPLLSE